MAPTPNDLSDLSSDDQSREHTPAASVPAPNPSARGDSEAAAVSMLASRGWSAAADTRADNDKDARPDEQSRRATRSSARIQASTIPKEGIVKQLAPYAASSRADGQNALADQLGTTQALKDIPSVPEKLHTLLASVTATKGAEDILALDPADRLGGYSDLEAWVEGSLDMYRPEFRPLLFPIFCHFYLDLIQLGLKDVALRFFSAFSPPLSVQHKSVLHHLTTLLLPMHVQGDSVARRFRTDKYTLRMSKSGFSLLIGWLTEGVGGEAIGAGEGFSGEAGKRGRVAVMQVVNNHLTFDIATSNSAAFRANIWEDAAGLQASLVSGGIHNTAYPDANAFNAARGPLMLAPAPLSEDLQRETEKVLRGEADGDPHAAQTLSADLQLLRPSQTQGLIEPSPNDLLPQPPAFKAIDVRREVERVRDARKRIRLDPSHLSGQARNASSIGPQVAMSRARSLPSICAYTLHDTSESVSCSTFSHDSSLLATGFLESYIRLWSLKGEKLRGLRSDFQESTIRDSSSLKRIKERSGSTTRKLVGHSGPVYSVSFDPVAGTAAPPRHLLSCSADATIRLWSLDTMTNLVAYRSHQNPVWDVQWSPMGIYFASASRDRTARLWSTERIAPLRIFAGHLSDVDCVRFHPNTLYLATGSSDWTCRLWDTHKGNCVRVFVGHQGAITALAMSNDGRYLASAGEDLSIHIWDMGSGNCIKKMTGHTATIYSMAFSAESSLLVTGSADWTVRCWDVKSAANKQNGRSVASNMFSLPDLEQPETSDLVATFPTKRTPIINVQFTPRNLCLVSGPSVSSDHR